MLHKIVLTLLVVSQNVYISIIMLRYLCGKNGLQNTSEALLNNLKFQRFDSLATDEPEF